MYPTLRPLLAVLSACLLGVGWSHADEPTPTPRAAPAATVQEVRTPALLPGDQTILLITVEDDDNSIEELRYGGITQSINVNPKVGLLPYEVQTTDGAHSNPLERSMNSAPLGPRLWNLFDF